ncbi:MAG: hypothetical protein PHD47_02375 [Acholeplasmataceae bacterium]|nr:hypothetical protein [Acholeplasmataceae bacterium]
MKKWFLFLFCVLGLTLKNTIINADSNYKAYEELNLESGKLLSAFTKSDFNKHYKKVTKRKFYGWRINQVNTDIKVTYKTETLFSYYNDGYSKIEYTYEQTKKSTKTRSLSSTGSIGVKVSGSVDKFKGGLDSSLKLTDSNSSTDLIEEDYKLKVSVEPGTMLNLYIYGEGLISNGVAANYLFWIRTAKGGYEIFTVTTQYYRLEMVKI